MSRKRFISIFGLLVVMALFLQIGCTAIDATTSEEASTGESSSSDEVAPVEEEKKLKVALVLPGPLGDDGFSDMLASGMNKAIEELPIDGTVVETSGNEEHEAAIRGTASRGFELILMASMNPDMILEVAQDFPDVRFAPIDMFFSVDTYPDNVMASYIVLAEPLFLGGVVAGMMTESNIIGAVAGVGGDAFIASCVTPLEQGAQEVNPDAKVLTAVAGDFGDPALGRELALSQIEEGADIIYHAAGLTGVGAIEAAGDKGVFAIGLESNEDGVAPGTVIVSVMRRLDLQVYKAIELTLDDDFTPGWRVFPLKDDLSGLSWDYGSDIFEQNGPENAVAKIEEIKAKVEEYRQKILNCEFTVNTAPGYGSCD